MLAPSVMMIEIAIDAYFKHTENMPDFIKKSQLKELHALGDERAQEIGATGLSNDLNKGYELGLATARIIIQGSVALIKAGVDPKNVL